MAAADVESIGGLASAANARDLLMRAGIAQPDDTVPALADDPVVDDHDGTEGAAVAQFDAAQGQFKCLGYEVFVSIVHRQTPGYSPLKVSEPMITKITEKRVSTSRRPAMSVKPAPSIITVRAALIVWVRGNSSANFCTKGCDPSSENQTPESSIIGQLSRMLLASSMFVSALDQPGRSSM
jgi:hypothetical protein